LNNAPTPEGRGQERPPAAEPFFPSEGPFNPVVPLSEIGNAPAVLPAVDPADVGEPAEAAWARQAHRAKLKEEEETLVPSRAGRARGRRQSWLIPASVIALSVAAGLASGTYLIWSSQRAPEPQPPARVATEATILPPAPDATPAPVKEQETATTKVERAAEPAGDEKPTEVAKAEKSVEAAHAPKQAPPPPQPAPRAERVARAAEVKEVTPAPKPARTQSAPTPRPRVTTAETHPPARTPPISSPPPSAKSKKVIQWP
jgi:hypothetical protein